MIDRNDPEPPRFDENNPNHIARGQGVMEAEYADWLRRQVERHEGAPVVSLADHRRAGAPLPETPAERGHRAIRAIETYRPHGAVRLWAQEHCPLVKDPCGHQTLEAIRRKWLRPNSVIDGLGDLDAAYREELYQRQIDIAENLPGDAGQDWQRLRASGRSPLAGDAPSMSEGTAVLSNRPGEVPHRVQPPDYLRSDRRPGQPAARSAGSHIEHRTSEDFMSETIKRS
jgi:hypothetical protein